MAYLIRKAERRDLPELVELLGSYMTETYNSVWNGTAKRLESDGFGREFEILVAEDNAKRISGFLAWNSTYDFHHLS